MFKKTKTAIVITSAIVLTACGGGGGGTKPNATTTTTTTTNVNTSAFTSGWDNADTSQWRAVKEENYTELSEWNDVFKKIDELQNRGVTSDSDVWAGDNIIIDGKELTIREAVLIIVGLKHKYYDNREEVWEIHIG